MNINDYINEMGDAFRGLSFTKEIVYMVAHMPSNWVIPASILEGYNVGKKEQNDEIYLFSDITQDASALFEAYKALVNHNQSLAEKKELFKAAVTELKRQFQCMNVETLKRIRFVYDMPETDSNVAIEEVEAEPLNDPDYMAANCFVESDAFPQMSDENAECTSATTIVSEDVEEATEENVTKPKKTTRRKKTE